MVCAAAGVSLADLATTSGRTMAFFDLRTWLACVWRSKLSTRVTVIFAAAIVVPWCIYAWLTVSEHAAHVERTERTLSTLAAAYGQHTATVVQLSAQGEADDELAAFREALNVPHVSFSLAKRDPAAPAGDAIVADADVASMGLNVRASMSKSEALREWRANAYAQAVALFFRSLFVAGIGWFLVRQLRLREAMEQELIRAKNKAEAASRAKSEFLANMSHELRTPLNAIIGFAEIIKKRTFGSASERYIEYAGDIHNSGTHLLGLINDILNLSKLEAGKLQLQEQDVDLELAVAACVNLIEPAAYEASIQLSVTLDPEALTIRADERRLRQILINLLSNAVKFTPDGGSVGVKSTRRNGGLAISVSDTGIGMAPQDIPKALAPFDQIERKVRRKQEGTGLGLPLARQLTELHGGTLKIESEIDAGTTVTILLPPSRMVAPRSELAKAV
jgi:signal transduction histidine kinase